MQMIGLEYQTVAPWPESSLCVPPKIIESVYAIVTPSLPLGVYHQPYTHYLLG